MRPTTWPVLPLALCGMAIVHCARERDAESVLRTPDGGAADATMGAFGDGAPPCHDDTVHCSSDLHSVLDCADQPRVVCPPDQGCAAGRCVPACDSATQNESSVGCEYFTFPIDDHAARGSCFAAVVANTWNQPVTIAVERAGVSLNVADFARMPSGSGRSISYTPLPDGKLPVGRVALLFLADLSEGDIGGDPFDTPPRVACPVRPAVTSPAFYAMEAADGGAPRKQGRQGVRGTSLGDAFRITASSPVVAFDVFPYGGGAGAVSSASLLLPTSAWGLNYVAVQPWLGASSMYVSMIAQADGTEVTILPKVDILPEDPSHLVATHVPGAPAGSLVTYRLSAGQVLQLDHTTGGEGLTGSPIQSNKPIGVVGSTPCSYLEYTACDSLHQQIPPVRALGSEYVAVRYRNRWEGHEEAPPWHIVGTVDGTTLTYEPTRPDGAPLNIGSGEAVHFPAAGPFVVRSQDTQHPFYMAGYMTGADDPIAGGLLGGPLGGPGDPEFVNVVPPAQYLSRYVFFTDPTYPETNLVFVRVKGPSGFEPVELDCVGPLDGWTPIGSSGTYEYTRFDLVRHDFQPQRGCDNGLHEAHSKAPFGLTVWGWGTSETGGVYGAPDAGGFFSQYVSYGYPAGMGLKSITTVVLPTSPK